ncbi:MAG TPA: sterol desaturase family protein [Lacunisphaera sp.]|jgi:sterol desaturase/sphingolipid hydroxylase (fatty acid hydroxylase superfamily)|nr:sterol desaturase family protein [Lacunisphaera sp.]HQY04946.1 sterol desaturase family protein [Lacunisphaera sp.]
MDQLWNPARLVIAFVVLCAIFVPLESLFPLVRRQSWQRPGVVTDIIHFFITGAIRKLLVIFTLVVLVYWLGFLVYPPLQRTMLSLPWWLQFVIANVVFDVGAYWGHRWAHTLPFLWRFHAVHHSSEHLDWVAASRLHPFDQTFIRICGILPVYLLGFTKETFGALIAFEGLLAIFIHANVRWRFGWLEWLVATPAFHTGTTPTKAPRPRTRISPACCRGWTGSSARSTCPRSIPTNTASTRRCPPITSVS